VGSGADIFGYICSTSDFGTTRMSLLETLYS